MGGLIPTPGCRWIRCAALLLVLASPRLVPGQSPPGGGPSLSTPMGSEETAPADAPAPRPIEPVVGAPATPPPAAPGASAAEDAATRLARIEAHLRALEARNQQLEQQHQDLMKRYQQVTSQDKAPVFGADANNPDGGGVPGGLVSSADGDGDGAAGAGKPSAASAGGSRAKDGKDGKGTGTAAKSQDGKQGAKQDDKKDDWYEIGSDGALKPAWKDRRLVFESAHKDFRIRFTGRFQWDTGFFNQTRGIPNLQDASDFRRARLGVEGYLYENFYFRTRYDFADASPTNTAPGGAATTNFRDVFARVEKIPYLGNIQGGQYKEMVSLTWQSSSNQLIFMERPAVFNALNPMRNVGLSQYRTFLDDRVFFNHGIFRSATNNGGFSAGDGEWAYTCRLVGLPYWYADGRYLVHIGGSYSHRAFNGSPAGTTPQPTYQTTGDILIGTPNLFSTGALTGVHNENLVSGEFVTDWGPLSIQSEVLAIQLNGPRTANPQYWGWYIQTSYFLTGENRRYRRDGNYGFSFTTPVPNEDFFTMNRFPWIFGRGAWEIAARYDYLDLSGGGLVVRPDANGVGGTGRWDGMTYAINWWLNSNSTIMFNWVHGWRNSDTRGFSGQMDALAMRLRFFF